MNTTTKAAPKAAPKAEQSCTSCAGLFCDVVLPPPSDTLWRFLTAGYSYAYITQLSDHSKGEARVLIDRALQNWRQICEEVSATIEGDHG